MPDAFLGPFIDVCKVGILRGLKNIDQKLVAVRVCNRKVGIIKTLCIRDRFN